MTGSWGLWSTSLMLNSDLSVTKTRIDEFFFLSSWRILGAMETPLLQTKLYIPQPRSELVSRSRLIERLNDGLQRELILISAPAGFGKTMLIADWGSQIADRAATQSDIKLAWLSLDKSDNDPVRFLTYFVAALQSTKITMRNGALGMLRSPQPPPIEAILTALINEIATIPGSIVLVLDDYHVIDAQPIHNALTFLLEHQPPQLHLVIATREDPLLPLARLRVRGQLTELRAIDLRFTSSEVAKFLNQVMALNLSAEDIAALENRTEGWIAGLQLAAISMQGLEDTAGFIKSFTGSHHFILDYLIEEVLEQQSEGVQTFLLQTAVLDRLTGPLCDAVCSVGTATGQGNGQATLELLEHANLFIVSLDEERRWYRYHHLFADLLRQRLSQTHPDSILTLHNRASEWYEQNGFIDEAIEYALRAEHFERVVQLIDREAEAVWMRGEHTKLRHWLDRLPVEWTFSKPQLCIFYAWSLFATGRQDAAEQSLGAAEKALDLHSGYAGETSLIKAGDQPSGPDRVKLQGRIAATRAFMAFFRGDVSGIVQHARQAIEYLPEQDLTWRGTATTALADAHIIKGDMTAAYQAQVEAVKASRAAGNIYMSLIANLKLAITLRQQGQLQRAIEICRQQMKFAGENGLSQTIVVGWLLAIWGEVLAELNDLDTALHQTKKGVELTRHGGDVAMLGWNYLCLTRVLFSSGDIAGAEETIQELEHIARETDIPPWVMNLLATWQARIWLAQGKLNAASQWVQERGLNADRDPTLLYEMDINMLLARVLIAQGQLDETITLLQRLLITAKAAGRTSRVIEILILQALTLQSQEDTDQAVAALTEALSLAEPGGFIRIFVDEGLPMSRLLYEALHSGIAPDYVRRLLAAFSIAEPEQPAPSKTQTPKSELVEPLSERELEVLQLIAEGLTNQEIACRLFLTLNTVKVHTRNIYGKLDAHSRTQAVARAKVLGILPSI